MKFSCEKCLYYTDSKFCFESHKKSKAHAEKENNEFEGKFQCKICNKKYKSGSGLWNHKIKCEEEYKRKEEEKKRKEEDEIKKTIIDLYRHNHEIQREKDLLQKENNEMKNMFIELSKKENITKIENHTNSHNKIDFNFFLNEKCKNAINMSSLIETIVVGMKDIDNIQKQGYVKTITDMVVEKINDYSVYERPLHYYIEDKPANEDEETPNETIHIKDNDIWNKENMSEHDVLLTNLNTINDVLQKKTKNNELMNQEVKSGRRYNKTGKIITNILETVKINENNLNML